MKHENVHKKKHDIVNKIILINVTIKKIIMQEALRDGCKGFYWAPIYHF